MSFFRETLWSTQDGNFIIADQKIVAALIADPVFNPKSKSTVKKSMVEKATPTLSTLFTDNTEISHFEEFEKFPTTKIQYHQFMGCTSLTSIVLPTGTTEIASGAFAYTSALGSITFPDTLTTIGSHCFMYSGINISEVPNTITSMEMSIFYSCSNIKTMNFNYAGTEVPHGTFENSSQLESVNIADHITVIGPYAFSNCIALTTANIPPYTTKIDQKAFRKCAQLSSITLPNTLTEIGEEAFRECTSINFTIPDTVTTIGNHAFDSSSLAPSKLPDSLTSLGFGAFSSCPTSITEIPSGLTEIKNNCLNSNTSYTITFPQSTKLTATQGDREYFKPFKKGTAILVNTQDLVDEYEADTTWKKGIDEQGYIFSIPGNITFEDPNVKSVLTATGHADYDGDGEIGYWEACKCTKLYDEGTNDEGNTTYTPWFKDNTTITEFTEFKNFVNITEISNCDWFEGCTSLGSIEIPDSITSISSTFLLNTCVSSLDLKNVSTLKTNLPSTIKTLKVRTAFDTSNSNTFRDCSSIENVYVYGGIDVWLSSIGTLGTRDSSSANLYVDDVLITEVTIPNTYTRIPQFPKFSHITSFTIPSTITTIPEYAFSLSSTVNRTFNFEDASKITRVENLAFVNNSASLSNDLFSNITYTGLSAFRNCTGLPTNLVLPNLTDSNQGAFASTNIETVALSKITYIKHSMFLKCANLTTVSAPNVTDIEDEAFNECANLTSINIDFDNLTTIGWKAFFGCSNLEWASGKELPEGIQYIKAYAFSGCTKIAFSTLPSTVIEIDQHAFQETAVTFSSLPTGLTSLNFGIFKDCPNVNISVLPEGITLICNRCLYGTAATSIEIKCPTKVTTQVGSWGTDWCPFPDNCVIKVATAELKTAYEADATWQIGMTNHGYTFVVA